MDHAQARIVGRDGKLRAHGDHVGALLEYGDARVREVAVAKLGQRAAAQADQDDVARARHEQGEADHGAAVGQQQAGRVGQRHGALEVAGGEFERAPVAAGGHQRGRQAGAGSHAPSIPGAGGGGSLLGGAGF